MRVQPFTPGGRICQEWRLAFSVAAQIAPPLLWLLGIHNQRISSEWSEAPSQASTDVERFDLCLEHIHHTMTDTLHDLIFCVPLSSRRTDNLTLCVVSAIGSPGSLPPLHLAQFPQVLNHMVHSVSLPFRCSRCQFVSRTTSSSSGLRKAPNICLPLYDCASAG